MSYLPLLGILIIVVGFALKLDTIAVVVIAACVTALASGMSIAEFLTTLGDAFVANRLVTLFVLTLPIVGLSERYGLKEQAVRLVNRIQGLTAGKFLSFYLLIREVAGIISVRLGGHPAFVRPLVEPMAQSAAKARYRENTPQSQELIKAQSAAMENIGNFFAQNGFVGAAGTLLIVGTMESLGYPVDAAQIALASLVVAGLAFLYGLLSNYIFDRRLDRLNAHTKTDKGGQSK
ncbi:DUF969 domain-containing protein [Aerococcus sp. UMB8608]|uniref:DUF969 domain-containing protein n=1 Tax=Aerococcus sanguinicola TaxID=119206 RepID=A0A5N1GP51_9LACT|nr:MULTISPECIES: DUF969 domain-containing protein [Aerococcus]KAA9302184.1 DUF969 domain-containing protein [Aerococcus sanguinicola]MDK6368385.1 DUF969 domain-containing protein [Aerococcus sp. UMB9870]MDK6679467.1 DUF969 domain-containing protein [Aerococcus sp. UMB8608]MDK6687234.1 DUF969 domain-containing protein [Aerococcus sp. UMB8623]MDK6941068.1 DUF969 domain-containing protein [Aerococcus sp. UMB8487]